LKFDKILKDKLSLLQKLFLEAKRFTNHVIDAGITAPKPIGTTRLTTHPSGSKMHLRRGRSVSSPLK